MANIVVIGLGISQPPQLSHQAKAAIAACNCLMGSPRQLESVIEVQGNAQQQRLALPKLDQIAEHIKAFENVVILASGDPLLFGIGKYLQQQFGDKVGNKVICMSGVSSLQGACEITGLSLQDAILVSLHGRPLSNLNRHLQPQRNLLILTDQHSHPQAIAQALVKANLGASVVHVCERLGYQDQRYQQFTANELAKLAQAKQSFADLHVTLVQTKGRGGVMPNFPGIPDTHFETGNEAGQGLLTKREVRLAILSLLQAGPGETGWDIGAGCGGVAVEWAYWNASGQVYAIEHHPARLTCLKANQEKFGVSTNLHIVEGRAPDVLHDLPPPDKVFVGGSGGDMDAILALVWQQLKPGGRLLASAVTEQTKANLWRFGDTLKQDNGLKHSEFMQLAVSRGDQLAGQDLLRPALPITLICWDKP